MLPHHLQLHPGSVADYTALAHHHYRAARPATLMRILAIRRDQPSVIGRFLQRRHERQTVAVLVESLPALDCRLRDIALQNRYRRWTNPRERAVLLNRELRCISRVIVHPQWRGLGLAVHLVRHALATATTCYTEAIAAMGAVHPFFERAGMTAYRRPRHAFDDRLVAALQTVRIEPIELALLDATCARIEALPEARKRWLLGEIEHWRRRRVQRAKGAADLRTTLQSARQRLFCEPVYYIHINATAPHA